jgi:hypothetical protein
MERLQAVLRVGPGRDLPALIASIHEAVRRHRGADDATLLALRAFIPTEPRPAG